MAIQPPRVESSHDWEVAERVSVPGELLFDLGPAGSRFECREEAVLVEIEQAIHAAEIDGDDRRVVGAGVDVPGDAGAAAVRDQADVGRAGVVEPGAYLAVRGRVCDRVRTLRDAAVAQGDRFLTALRAGAGDHGGVCGCIRGRIGVRDGTHKQRQRQTQTPSVRKWD